MTSTPRILATLLAATAVALTAACGDSTGGAAVGPSHHPGPSALPPGRIVYQISEGGGFIAPDYALSILPSLTVYGDGTAYRAVPSDHDGPGSPWTYRVGRVDAATLARLVADADRSGLFDGTDFGTPGITDVGGTTVRLRTGNGPAKHAYAYALGFSDGDSTLTSTQLADRRYLRRIDARFVRAVHYRGGSWTPTRVAVIDRQTGVSTAGGSGGSGALPWPGPAPARLLTQKSFDGPCGVVHGAAAASLFRAARAHGSTHWTFHGADVYLLVRAVLPGEPACPN